MGCMVKRRSKVLLGEKPPVYEKVETDQIQIAVTLHKTKKQRKYMITYRIIYDVN